MPHQIIIKVNGSVATLSKHLNRRSSSDAVVTHDEKIPVTSFKSNLSSRSEVTILENQNLPQTNSANH